MRLITEVCYLRLRQRSTSDQQTEQGSQLSIGSILSFWCQGGPCRQLWRLPVHNTTKLLTSQAHHVNVSFYCITGPVFFLLKWKIFLRVHSVLINANESAFLCRTITLLFRLLPARRSTADPEYCRCVISMRSTTVLCSSCICQLLLKNLWYYDDDVCTDLSFHYQVLGIGLPEQLRSP